MRTRFQKLLGPIFLNTRRNRSFDAASGGRRWDGTRTVGGLKQGAPRVAYIESMRMELLCHSLDRGLAHWSRKAARSLRYLAAEAGCKYIICPAS